MKLFKTIGRFLGGKPSPEPLTPAQRMKQAEQELDQLRGTASYAEFSDAIKARIADRSLPVWTCTGCGQTCLTMIENCPRGYCEGRDGTDPETLMQMARSVDQQRKDQ